MLLIQNWPLILALAATLLLLYQLVRSRFSADQFQKDLTHQNILTVANEMTSMEEDPETNYWLERWQRIQQNGGAPPVQPHSSIRRLRTKGRITISLIWTLIWSGAFAFLTTRIILNPYYFGNEANLLGYFAYYIALGLIQYFRR